MKSLERSIYETLAFFDLFDHPLALEELARFVLRSQKDVLFCLESSPFFGHFDGFYFLKGRENTSRIRRERFFHQQKLWKKVRRFTFLLRWVPFVEMLAVCNRLSYNAATEQSDIDFFVVTKSGRLFLARTFFMFFLALFGIRLHDGKMPGKFCLSFLVSEDAINLDIIRLRPNDIYLAYWSTTLCPIFGREMYSKFLNENILSENAWAREYFPDGILPCSEFFVSHFSFFRKILEFFLSGGIGDFFEKKLCDWQMARALKKWHEMGEPAGIIISKNMLKFHEPDIRSEFQKKWEEKLAL